MSRAGRSRVTQFSILYKLSGLGPMTVNQMSAELVMDRTYRAQARLPLDDLVDYLEDELDYDLEFDEEITDNVETVAGLLSYELGRVPLPGSYVEVDGLRYTAEGGHDRRGRVKVRTVLIDVPEQPREQDRYHDGAQ